MFKKLNKKGFTLAELLVVVAIIGVLVAVSIPIFTSQLEKSREATDLANLRAAKAAGVVAYLSEDSTLLGGTVFASTPADATLYYNAAQGKLVTAKADADKIGKGTATKGGCEATKFGTKEYTQDTVAKDDVIQVTIKTTGDIDCEFVAAS